MSYQSRMLCLTVTLVADAAFGGDVSVVPRPAMMDRRPESFAVTKDTSLLYTQGGDEIPPIAEYLSDILRNQVGVAVQVAQTSDSTALPANSIVLTLDGAEPACGDEGYELLVDGRNVLLRALRPQGLFLGVQTLRQLLPPEPPGDDGVITLPGVHIADRPRYRHRGMLLDCCRHFMPKAFIKRYIDLLALHKLNVLHWHLTEDQGWRLAIRKHPRLTEVGAWRGEGKDRYGGFYSQDDVKEIVAYAKSRYITVIPEIELPGHSQAALAAYPSLSCTGGPFSVGTRWGVYDDVYCAGSEETFRFLEDVLSEVIELFPSEHVHIGGDECPKTRWKACAKCQARIKSEGLKDEHELQSYFIRRIEKLLNSKGRRIIGWDEILEGGLAPNATVQSWRGMDGAIAATTAGHDVVVSPGSHCYLDHAQADLPGHPMNWGVLSIETVYSFEPTPPQLTPAQAQHVLGVEGNMWSEYAPPHLVDRQVFPRMCALSEVMWSPKNARDWNDFQSRMAEHERRLDALGVAYFQAKPEPASIRTPKLAEWESLQYGMLIHFGLSTFVNDEPGSDVAAGVFKPTALDVDQWIRVARDAGMRYAVLTAKHCTGHGLWPSELTEHDVAASPVKTDVVREFVNACAKYGVKPGLYYQLGRDAHHQPKMTSSEHEAFCKGQLTELLTKYGPITQITLDVAHDSGPDTRGMLRRLYDHVHHVQPACLVIPTQGLAGGGDVASQPAGRRSDLQSRSVDQEHSTRPTASRRSNREYNSVLQTGRADEPQLWPRDVTSGRTPPSAGHDPRVTFEGRTYYVPLETCDTLGERWFWSPDDTPRPALHVYRQYRQCMERRANFLLNVGPDSTGRVPDLTVQRLMELKAMIDERP